MVDNLVKIMIFCSTQSNFRTYYCLKLHLSDRDFYQICDLKCIQGSCSRTEGRTAPVFIVGRLDLFYGREGGVMYVSLPDKSNYALYSEITRLHGLVNCMTFNPGNRAI